MDLLRAIQVFIAVVENGSFSAASGKLNLATSAVSKKVSELEDYYQCKLLNRSTRSMNLTADGKHLMAEFKALLNHLNSLKEGVSERKNKVIGELKISTPENAIGLGIDRKISQFMKLFPNVAVSWQQQNKVVDLIEDSVDVAFRIGKLSDSNLLVRHYSEVENLFVASPEFIKEYGSPTHPTELPHFQCIVETANRMPWRWRYQENGIEKRVNISGKLKLDKGETVAFFAAQGHGIAHLPSFMMQGYLDRGELIPILSDYNTEPLKVSMVYPHSRSSNSALNAFIEFVLQART